MKVIMVLLSCGLLLNACNEYGKKVSNKNIEVYYQEGITPNEAQRTADMLYTLNSATDSSSSPKSFQLNKRSDTILVRMVADARQADAVGVDAFQAIGILVADSIFKGKPVAIELTDERSKSFRYIAYNPALAASLNSAPERDPAALKQYGEHYQDGNVEVFYKSGVSANEAMGVQAFLLREMAPEDLISFQLMKDSDGKMVINMASTKEQAASFDKALLNSMAEEVSAKLLGGDQVTFSVTDQAFNIVQTTVYPVK